MKKLIVLLTLFMVSQAHAAAPDRRISDADGHVLNINSDGTIPVTLSGGGGGIPEGTSVECTDDLATAVAAATAGDTLVLGACEYEVDAEIDVDKSLRIVCASGGGSHITDATGFTDTSLLNVTAAPFAIHGCAFEYDSGAQRAMTIDARGGDVFDYKDVLIVDPIIHGTGTGTVSALQSYDTGMIVVNPYIVVTGTAMTGSNQLRTIFNIVESTAEADVETFIFGGGYHEGNSTSDSVSVVNKPLFCWNNGSDESTNDITCNYYDQTVKAINTTSTGVTYGILSEGTNVTVNCYNCVMDGGTHGDSTSSNDIGATQNGVINLYNTFLVNGNTTASGGGVINRNYGTLNAYSLLGGALAQQKSHLAAIDILSLSGQQGGDKPGTGSQTGLEGADALLTLGAGGKATEATTTGTGGDGGDFVVTGAAGSAQDIATSTTNVGGAGSLITLVAGNGGAASNAGTTNTGGAGGTVTITGGAGGTGTTTGGNGGSVVITAGAAGSGGSPTPGSVVLDYPTSGQGVGIKTSAPIHDLSFGAGSGVTRTQGVVRQSSGSVNGANLTISAGAPASGATDKQGGTLTLSSGASTGDVGGVVLLQVPIAGAGTGTTDRTPVTRLRINSSGLTTIGNSADSAAVLFVDGNLATTTETLVVQAIGSQTANLFVIENSGGTDYLTFNPTQKLVLVPPSSQTIAAGNTVTADACGGLKPITSAGSVTTSTTDTFTAPAAANGGCCLSVVNVGSNDITLDNNANFVSAGAADVVLGANDSVRVCSTGASGKWYQIGATGNN